MEVILVLIILLIVSLAFANYVFRNDSKYVTVSDYKSPFTGKSLLTLINYNSKFFLLDGSLVLFDCGNDCLQYGDFPVNQAARHYDVKIIPSYENLSLYSDITGPSNPAKEDNNAQLFELYHRALTCEELKKELRIFPDREVYFRCKDEGSIGLNYITDIEVEEDKLILKSI